MRHLIMGTAGHVDHGKTALIKALTDFDCDTHKQEKERGITINLGFSHLDLPSGDSLGIVDVPGHKDFIKTMVAGAFGIDIVLLVIAADSGVMPQTIEHLNIIKMLGIENGIVALNKADLIDEETLELGKEEVRDLLKGSSLENAPVIGVSSITGRGIDELISEIDKQIMKVPERKKEGFFRMFIDRIFVAKGFGSVVTGSVMSGSISSGKDVYVLPGHNTRVKIRSIQKHGNTVDQVFSGDRAAINLTGFKAEDFKKGMILSSQQIESTQMLDASISLFDNNFEMGTWTSVIFLAGTFECLAKIHLLDKESLKENETGIVQIHLEIPFPLLHKEKFIFRNTSNTLTLGGGTIIDISPLHHRKRTPKLISELTMLAEATLHSDRLFDLIKLELKKENKPMSVDEISAKIKRPKADIIKEYAESDSDEVLKYDIQGRNIFILRSVEKEFYDKILETIRQWHKRNPILEEGFDAKGFTGKLGLSGNTGKIYVEKLLEKVYEDGLIRKVEDTWALKDHAVKIDPKTQEQIKWVEKDIENYLLELPGSDKLEESALINNINKERFRMILRYLVKEDCIGYSGDEYYHISVIDQSRKQLLKHLLNKEQGINEKEMRLLLDCSKRAVQVLLGRFIEEGVVEKKTFYVHITDKGKGMLG